MPLIWNCSNGNLAENPESIEIDSIDGPSPEINCSACTLCRYLILKNIRKSHSRGSLLAMDPGGRWRWDRSEVLSDDEDILDAILSVCHKPHRRRNAYRNLSPSPIDATDSADSEAAEDKENRDNVMLNADVEEDIRKAISIVAQMKVTA